MRKQRFDLWVLSGSSFRLLASNQKAKKCKRIAIKTKLLPGEIILKTPVSSVAYSLVFCVSEAVASQE